MSSSASSNKRLKNIAFYAIVILLAVLLPVILELSVFSSLVGATRNVSKMQEFFGFSGFLSVLSVVAWTLKTNRPTDLAGHLNIFLPALIALLWLNILTESTLIDWDYICYQDAAQFLLNGKNPYQASLDCYYYPPLLVFVFSWTYTSIQYIVTAIRGIPLQYDNAWMLIFYLYQCLQWFLIIVAYFLSLSLVKRYKLNLYVSMGVVALVYILNNPLLRTVHFYQINLWILNVSLLVLLFSSSHPFITGLSAAFGTHLKLYPAVFVAPWSLQKNWKAVLGFGVGLILLFILITASYGNLSIWFQFIYNDPTGAGGFALRDNSLHSFVYNLLRIIRVIEPGDLNSIIPEMLTAFSVFLVLAWFLFRMINRHRVLKETVDPGPVNVLQVDGQYIDMVGMMLLISPVAWEHHYVLAIPVLIWTFTFQVKENQVPVASILAFLLIFGLPTFDIFPLSYLRLSGLLILLIVSDPMLILKRNAKKRLANTESASDYPAKQGI